MEHFATRGRQRSEEKDPQLAAAIRTIVEPHSQVDPELKSSRWYSNLWTARVREALLRKGSSEAGLPDERTMQDILNRMNYRLKRIQMGKPLKKTKEAEAIFVNIKRVREEAETLEISMAARAMEALGDHVRVGKGADRLGR